MGDAIDCPNCGKKAEPISAVASMREYLCGFCGNKFFARINYIEDAERVRRGVFKVFLDLRGVDSLAKLRIKALRAFERNESFRRDILQSQPVSGVDEWDVGTYSEVDAMDLLDRAKKSNIKIRLVPINES